VTVTVTPKSGSYVSGITPMTNGSRFSDKTYSDTSSSTRTITFTMPASDVTVYYYGLTKTESSSYGSVNSSNAGEIRSDVANGGLKGYTWKTWVAKNGTSAGWEKAGGKVVVNTMGMRVPSTTSTLYIPSNTEPSQYATGLSQGAVTYTGLAMLHGSKQSPEWVVNTAQAANITKTL